MGKPPSSSRPKLYAVTPLPKSTAIPKVGETNALSNQVTSNSVPSSQELKVRENDNVIDPRMFRIDPCDNAVLQPSESTCQMVPKFNFLYVMLSKMVRYSAFPMLSSIKPE
ncbi:hypothetical protein Tco_0977559 [Tanacetum coccineum]|uniref:Uncharacterized protein n=1 Tax=Tanacetum coccineum TaxID=301880 RepID=A0ABQ5ELJ3_9ASTR